VEDRELRTYNTAGVKENGTFYDNEVDDYGQTHLHAIYHHQWSDLHLQTTLHYTKGAGFYEQYRSSDDLSDYGLNLSPETDDLVRRRWLDNDFYGMIFNLSRSKPQYSWSIGGGANQYLGDHFGEVIWVASEGEIPPQDYYRNDAIKNDVNLYGQYQYSFPGRWTVFTDLQWRTVEYKFQGFSSDLSVADQKVNHHFFNPKLGIEKKLGAFTTYYSLGVAHREPNRDDYVQSTPSSRPTPERLIDHELGIRLEQQNLAMSLNLFMMDYKDQLVLTGSINDVGEYNRVNVQESYRRGLEYSLNWRLVPRLSMGGTFTYNRSRIKYLVESIDNWDTGEQIVRAHRNVPISFSPEIVNSLYADWTLMKMKRSDLKLRTDYRFVGKQYLDNTGDDQAALEAYRQTDLTILMNWYPQGFNQITLKGQIVNLFDRSIISNGWVYRYVSSGYDARPDDPHATHIDGDTYTLSGFYPQAGIHFLFGVTMQF
ncbi:MAG: TonB-dependent receptor, partial [Saprospiraceae bacterium]|nr:TonB-dependent receptor [Saprospiraceae bacterium]